MKKRTFLAELLDGFIYLITGEEKEYSNNEHLLAVICTTIAIAIGLVLLI
jgi:hypothetical protein